MNWFTGLMVYLMTWWMVLFTVLPWGNRASEKPEPGHEAGAPERPRLWMKIGVTTIIATLIWGIIFYIVESDIITFR